MASAEYVLSLQGSRVSFKSKIGPEQLLIAFERTIRVPDNRNVNNLPPGLGEFPLYKVEDYNDRLPRDMSAKQGLFMPIYREYCSVFHEYPLLTLYCKSERQCG